jgi:hypothetical protein
MGVSASATALAILGFDGGSHEMVLWTWMAVGDFRPAFGLHLDGLSLTMLGVITGVGFLIHLFASWYMRGEEGYSRFFSYMNLFVASMVLLVLGNNLMMLYLGWEGVGVCSYLLIGFYYRTVANGNAALKAFIVTRVGDVFMAIGMFILLQKLGTLDIQEMLRLAPQVFTSGDPAITWATLMLLGGAVVTGWLIVGALATTGGAQAAHHRQIAPERGRDEVEGAGGGVGIMGDAGDEIGRFGALEKRHILRQDGLENPLLGAGDNIVADAGEQHLLPVSGEALGGIEHEHRPADEHHGCGIALEKHLVDEILYEPGAECCGCGGDGHEH